MSAGVIQRHRTALARTDLSRPLRTAMADNVLGLGHSVMDYGCGRGGDVRSLLGQGYDCTGWDPAYAPDGARREADVVNLGYVVNVIEQPLERRAVLERAWSLARRVLVISARLSGEMPDAVAGSYADGLVTRRGTFQKFYDQLELKNWIDQSLGVQSVAAAPGIFYVFRDPGDRLAFLASRHHRRAVAPRLRLSDQLAATHRDLLDELSAFLFTRGRLPAEDEFPQFGRLRDALGSVARAFRLLERSSDPTAWELVRRARVEDTLVFLALSRFEGRPRMCELPLPIQRDLKAFFGTYSEACRSADALLFSLGRPERLQAALASAPVGKLMPVALYIHQDAVGDLPTVLRLYEGCARAYVGKVEGTTLVKLRRDEPKVSYLSYPHFESDPHPALAQSLSIHLQTFRLKIRQYDRSPNPPVLHRKDACISADHRLHAKFARLTRLEEGKGLYEDPAVIGTREGWERTLRLHRWKLSGHRLVRTGAGAEHPIRA